MLATQKGMTLIELVMVIIIIGILAGVGMKSMESAIDTGRIEATKTEMNSLAQSIVGNPSLLNGGVRTDYGYVGDVGALPISLDNLVSQPSGYTTWNGPYISSNFSEATDDYKEDGWGTEYTYTGGVTIISTGSGSNLTKQYAGATADLTANSIQGTIIDGGGSPPGTYNSSVDIILSYPDGAGSMTSSTTNPNASGNYSFTAIPIGNHTITAVNTSTDDTVLSYVSVPPRSSVVNNFRFGVSLWSTGGGGGGGGSLEYVAGSATTNGWWNDDVEFDIYNNTGANITISWLEAEYTHSPTAYYERVRWNSGSVANETNPRFASTDRANFSSSRTINDGATVTIELENFRRNQTGGGPSEDMTGSSFSITFSDGSVITFAI